MRSRGYCWVVGGGVFDRGGVGVSVEVGEVEVGG